MRTCLVAYFLIFLSVSVMGQSPTADTTKKTNQQKTVREKPKSYMPWQVKHISEFVARFNYENLPGGTPFTDSTRQLYPRAQYLRMLFNNEDARFQKTKSGTVSLYTSQVQEFIQTIGEQKIMIPAQAQLEAVAKLRVRYNNIPDTLVIRLRKTYNADSASSWEIIHVKPPRSLRETVRTTWSDTIKRIDFPPNAHEVLFLPMLRGLNDYKSFGPFTSPDVRPDHDWQRTETALQKGKLLADAVLSSTVYIPIGSKWTLELNEFIREDENSGWLISNLLHNQSPAK